MNRETDWAAGYVTELDYTHGYYRELCPGMLRLACLSAGVVPPASKPLRYLELGYGQGLSINIHAAAVAGEFWGTDFNPRHAAQARTLAEASGAGPVLLDDAFAELAARPDLPEFDIIALHGIWTWISDENRREIADIIRRKLRIGGLVFLSYNCFPGWAPAMPLRHLMTLHSELAGSEAGGATRKVEDALAFALRVADSGALYFRAFPGVTARLKKIAEQDRNYLAHEYFNRNWELMAFSDVAQWLDEAKLSFVASAHPMDHVDSVNLTAEGQRLLAEIQNPILKQSVRDYLVNQQFRRDVFMKGPQRLTTPEQQELLRSEAFVLTTHPDDVPQKVLGPLGEATLHEHIYGPLIQVLAENEYAPKQIGELAAHAKLKSLPFGQLVQAMMVLAGAGHVHPAQPVQSESARGYCQALNRHLCERARTRDDIGFLAAPVTGGGVPVPRIHQLWLLASQEGKKTVADQAGFVWSILSGQGQRLVREGKPIESAKENLAELTRMAREFATKRLPILKTLEVAGLMLAPMQFAAQMLSEVAVRLPLSCVCP
jgi:hypothetical protein